MTWRTGEERLALLELLVQGTLKRRRAQEAAWGALAELPWTRLTGRRGELKLVAEHRHELVGLLDRVWPMWSDALAALTARGLAATPKGGRSWRTNCAQRGCLSFQTGSIGERLQP